LPADTVVRLVTLLAEQPAARERLTQVGVEILAEARA
jgi:hypothetical protein